MKSKPCHGEGKCILLTWFQNYLGTKFNLIPLLTLTAPNSFKYQQLTKLQPVCSCGQIVALVYLFILFIIYLDWNSNSKLIYSTNFKDLAYIYEIERVLKADFILN